MFVEPVVDALDPEDLPDNVAVFVPVNSDITQFLAYRAGFQDAVDGHNPARSAYAYERGYRNGELFRDRISGLRQWPAEPVFPGWPFDPRQLPPALRYWHKGLWSGGWRPIVITPGKHGGDRKSAAFKERAATP